MNKIIDFTKKGLLFLFYLLPVLSVFWLQHFDAKNWYIVIALVLVFTVMYIAVKYLTKLNKFGDWINQNSLAYGSLSFALALAIFAGIVMTELNLILMNTIILCYEIWVFGKIDGEENKLHHKLKGAILQTLFFIILLLTVSSIIANFSQSLMIWISLLSLLSLSIALIEKPEFFQMKIEYKRYPLFLLILLVVGIISTIYMFKGYEASSGIDVGAMFAIISFLLCLFILFLVFAAKKKLNKFKKEAAEADKKIEKRRNRRIEVDI